MREAAGASLIADANALRQLPRFVAAKESAATATAAAPAMTNRLLRRCDLACPEPASTTVGKPSGRSNDCDKTDVTTRLLCASMSPTS